MAARLQTRFTPVLSFKRDDSVKKSVELSRLIDEAIAADRHPAPTPAETVASGAALDLPRGQPAEDDAGLGPS